MRSTFPVEKSDGEEIGEKLSQVCAGAKSRKTGAPMILIQTKRRQSMTDIATRDIELDVRGLPCVNRRAIIFGNFDQLSDGESLIVINDHEPVGLRGHFEDIVPGRYRWEALPRVDEAFRVRITRSAFDPELAREGAAALAALARHSCDH